MGRGNDGSADCRLAPAGSGGMSLRVVPWLHESGNGKVKNGDIANGTECRNRYYPAGALASYREEAGSPVTLFTRSASRYPERNCLSFGGLT